LAEQQEEEIRLSGKNLITQHCLLLPRLMGKHVVVRNNKISNGCLFCMITDEWTEMLKDGKVGLPLVRQQA